MESATSLLDWRRQVASLYAEVRAAPDPRVAHQVWRNGRDELLRSHSESPIPADRRASFTGVPVPWRQIALRTVCSTFRWNGSPNS